MESEVRDCVRANVGHYEVDEPFWDGYLYVLYGDYEDMKVHSKIMCAEYDAPITLNEILNFFPKTKMVIFESALGGSVYKRINNEWLKVGKTIGYA